MTRLRALSTAAAAAVLAMGAFSAPAGAADAPSITIDSPGSGAVSDSPSVSISGTVTMHPTVALETNRLTGVTIQLTSDVHPGPLPSCSDCWQGDFSGTFSWDTPALAWNGPYSAVVTAAGRENPVDLNGVETSSATRDFRVAVAPAAPGNVKAVVNPDRTVTVSWAANSEPDTIGYRVQRKDPSASGYVDAAGLVGHPKATLIDPVPAQGGGGAYAYRVQAIRPGGSGGSDTAMGSAFSDTGVSVPAPSGAPAPPGGVPGGVPGGAPGGGAVPPPANAPLDLAGFLGGGAPPQVSLPGLPGQVALPDGTFESTLPYGPGARVGSGPGASRVAGLVNAGSGSNRRALLVPIAAGLLLGVAAVHLRMFGRRVAMEPPARG